jgi:hypothetical protein
MNISENEMKISLEFQKSDRSIDESIGKENDSNYYGSILIDHINNYNNFAIISNSNIVDSSNKIDLAIDIRNFDYSFVNIKEIINYSKSKRYTIKSYSTFVDLFFIINSNKDITDQIFTDDILNLNRKYGRNNLIIGYKYDNHNNYKIIIYNDDSKVKTVFVNKIISINDINNILNYKNKEIYDNNNLIIINNYAFDSLYR